MKKMEESIAYLKSITPQNFEVAVIGMSSRFPGAKRHRYLWSNLINGINSITEIPVDRWDINKYYSSDFKEPDKSISKWGGFLDDIDQFDNKFFNISPREAKYMDPQQRVLLEEVWKCIENSGLSLTTLSREITSVYVGVMAMDYYQSSLVSTVVTDSFSAAGNYGCILANRVSYYFGFRGVSMTLDAACSSSLVAMDTARRELYLGECDYAVAAGINLNYSPFRYISYSKSRMLSPEGQCKTFDKDANGFVPGEGLGVLLMQPLEKAIKDGNNILGILKGSATNHVGHSISMTAPRVGAQTELFLKALNNAGIDPESINYVEVHGTGTTIGDPIEIEALTRAFRMYTEKTEYCKVGTIKTNIGHLEAASGIAGVVKVLLMLKYKKIPPTLNVKTLNPIIDFVNSPFSPALEASDWEPVEGYPRRAAVGAFGFGGVNAHVILEEYVEENDKMGGASARTLENGLDDRVPDRIFVLSAKSKLSLEQLLVGWRYYVDSEDFQKYTLDEICQTLKRRRESFTYRYALVLNSKRDLKRILQSEEASTYIHSQRFEQYQKGRDKPLVLKIGDPGNTALSNFSILYESDEQYRNAFGMCKTAISEITFLNVLHSDPNAQEKYKNLYNFSILYSLVRTLLHSGVYPHVICGEGLGQWVALCISGVIGLKDSLLGILNQNYLRNITLSRPKWPIYLQSSDLTIHPFYFDQQYKQHLIKDVKVSSSLIHSHIHKANLLRTCQFTFKKLIDEWNNQFPKYIEKNLYTLLENDKWWEKEGEETEYNKVLLLVIVLNCLRTLNQKWNLSENLPELSAGVYELLDLISDKLVTQEEVIQLLQPDFSDFTSLADKVHSRQAGLDVDKPYEFLRKINVHIRELENQRDWIDKIGKQPIETNEYDDALSIEFGRFERQKEGDHHLKIHLDDTIERSLAHAVMELWLYGVDINWKRYSRIPLQEKASALPTYFFDQKRFWVEQKKAIEEKPKSPAPQDSKQRKRDFGGPSPIKATGSSNRFVRHFNPETDQIVEDHSVTGFTTVPSASIIEMVLDAAGMAFGGRYTQLLGLSIRNRSIVKDQNSLVTSFDLTTGKFEVSDNELLLCVGQIGKHKERKLPHINIDELKSGKKFTADRLYEFFSSAGYGHGETLQVIQELYIEDDYTLVSLKSPNSTEGTKTGIDPYLLDGIFQSAFWLGERKKNMFSQDFLLVLHSINKINIRGYMEEECYVLIEHKYLRKRGGDSFILDAEAYNEYGEQVISIEGLLLKRVRVDFLQNKLPKEISPIVKNERDQLRLCSPRWVLSKMIGKENMWDREEVILIFMDERKVGAYLGKVLEQKGVRPVLIQQGNRYSRLDERVYQIDPESEDDYERLFRELQDDLKERAKLPFHIFFMNSFGTLHSADINKDRLMTILKGGINSFFCLGKTITKTPPHDQVSVIIPTMDNFLTGPGDIGTGFAYGTLFGLSKVLELENKKIAIKQIDFSSQDKYSVKQICEKILLESEVTKEEREIAIRGNGKLIRKIREDGSTRKADQAILKDGRTYLITGGFNEISLNASKGIIEKVNVNLIIIGERELKPVEAEQLKVLTNSGSQIEYRQINLSDMEESQEGLNALRTQYGQLNGVILADEPPEGRLIISKEINTFQENLNKRILGAWNINEATRQDNLEFFIAFSSVISLVGTFGQAEYAAGNAFLNHFIQYRKQQGGKGHSIVVNWSPWIQEEVESNGLVEKHLNSLGLTPITPAQMGQKIDSILSADLNQVIVVSHDPEKIKWKFS